MNHNYVARLLGHLRTPLYRNSYALMVSTALGSALGLVYWMLAARFYPSDVVGLNSAAVSVMIFLSGVAQFNLMSAMIRFIPNAGGATRQLVGSAYLVSLSMSVLVGAVFLLGVNIWSPSLGFLRTNPWLILWFILGIMAWSVFALQDNVLTGLRQTIWVPIENILYAGVKIVLLITFASSLTTYGIFASWTAPLIAALIPINLLIFRRFIPRHVTATHDQAVPLEPRQIAHFVAGNYVAQLFFLASSRLLPLVVLYAAGASANAYFFLPWTIAFAIKLMINDMVMSLTVEGVSKQSSLAIYSYEFLLHIVRLSLPMIAVVLVSAPYILRLSGNDYAAEGTALLRLLTLSVIPSIFTSLYIGIARVGRRVGGIIAAQGALSTLIIGLSFGFLRMDGITGIGWAVVVSESIVAIVVMLTQLRPLFRAARSLPGKSSS